MTSNSTSPIRSKSPYHRRLALILVAASLFLLTGCQATGRMRIQPYNRPLSASDFFADGSSARKLVAGTVPQTDQRADDPALTGKTDIGDYVTTIPVQVTSELVKRGQERYEIYCSVCHGVDGHGDGKLVTAFQFPAPPDLQSEDAKNELPDGEIFEVIETGKNVMLSYGYRVKAPDRWAVIAYIRALQLKGSHLTQDLTPEELQQLGTK